MIGRDGNEASDHWATPKWLYNKLDNEFNFDFDPCPLNADFNGLEIEWGNSNFVNPPYNRKDKPLFIEKAFSEALFGKLSILLIPVSTSTKIFHDLILPFAEIKFLKGRVAFEGINTKREFVKNTKGKHDSMIVIFRPFLNKVDNNEKA